MNSAKQATARKSREDAATTQADDTVAADYSDNMFRDGNNRAAKLTSAKGYDKAAHDGDVTMPYGNAKEAEILLDSNLDAPDDQVPETLLALKQDTSRSRDGTDSSGTMDESGGFLGGDTQEVDDLEATSMPVDKIPHMND